MSSKNVALRKDVYDALHRELRPGESFTRLLLRLLAQRGPLADLRGTWGPADERTTRTWRSLRGGGRR